MPPLPDAPRPGSPRVEHLRSWAFSFQPPANRLTALLRIFVRIILIMGQEFSRTHIPTRASALTLAIILSLVPMLALSTAVLKGLGSDDKLKLAAFRLIEQIEPTDAKTLEQALPPAVSATAEAPLTPASVFPPGSSMSAHLHRAVNLLFDYVDRTNFAALGIVGIIGLIVIVIMVLSSIEDAMNAIWHARRGRSLFRKTMDYLALLVLLPISLNIALAGDAILANKTLMGHIGVAIPFAWVTTLLLQVLPFLFIVLTLMFLYLFFPHVKVKTSAAFAGALFAATFWFIVQKAYLAFQIGVANYNAIYGSFATIPLFLIWLHLGWTFILLGASLAYAVQNHSHHQPENRNLSPRQRLQIAFDILELVYRNFSRRQATSTNDLAMNLPTTSPATLDAVAGQLVAGGLLNAAEDNSTKLLTPVAPETALKTSEIVQLILGAEDLPGRGGEFAARAVEGAGNAVHAMRLTSSSGSREST